MKTYSITNGSGTTFWLKGNKFHKTNGPAVVSDDGYKAWWLNGKRRRIDGPAIIEADGTKYWYLHGKLLDPVAHFLKVGELELDKS